MKLARTQPSRLLAIIALVSCGLFFQSENQSQAQWHPSQIRSEYGSNTQIQYAPDDPSTRSRLFNLHTGHAGAFYNCDGEEDKRNSPYICWKTGHGDRLHRTFWDVLQWKRDRSEIAQRICDGAGTCCSGGQCNQCERGACAGEAIETPATCGCSTCSSAKASKPVTLLQRAVANAPTRIESSRSLQPKVSAAGLVGSGRSVVSQSSQNQSERNSLVKFAVRPSNDQSKPCDCLSCRMKRQGASSNTSVLERSPSSGSTATTLRSASLLDRARSSRTQR